MNERNHTHGETSERIDQTAANAPRRAPEPLSAGQRRVTPFDLDLATAPTFRAPMHRVIDLLHVTHAPERVHGYLEAMHRGERFPPISVLRLGRFFIVTDGHKRLTAYKHLDMDTIDVELWSVGRLVRDLIGQSTRHAGAAGKAVCGLFRDRDGRREARLFVAGTAGHWKRTVLSLWRLVLPKR